MTNQMERAGIPEVHLQVLRKIITTLQEKSIRWVVTGSLGMALQGIPLEIHDIDIQTDETGIFEIEEAFKEFSIVPVEYRESDRIRSFFGKLEIDQVQIDIMGDVQTRFSDQDWLPPVEIETHRIWLPFETQHVPVLPLEYEYQAYQRMGRSERAAILRAWLDR